MRPKYKAWDKEQKLMSTSIQLGQEKAYFYNGTSKDILCVHKYNPSLIFLEYTGLLDKKGIEIYEGDIVKIDDSDTISHWMSGEICIIKCLPGRFKVETKTGDGNMMQEDMQDVIEVIGNIYSNPELLKETL